MVQNFLETRGRHPAHPRRYRGPVIAVSYQGDHVSLLGAPVSSPPCLVNRHLRHTRGEPAPPPGGLDLMPDVVGSIGDYPACSRPHCAPVITSRGLAVSLYASGRFFCPMLRAAVSGRNC